MAEQQDKGSKEKGAKKQRKKKWFSLVADGIFENAPLGESLVYTADDLKGRVIGVNLMTLTNDMKQQNITVKFMVHEIKGDIAYASLASYEMLASSIKRMVRKDVERVDSSFVVETKDNIKLRVKPLLVARTSTSVNTAKLLRRMSMEFLVSQINNMSYDDFASGVLGKELPAQMRTYLKKVYPLKVCEIRAFTLTTKGVPVKLLGERIKVPEQKKREEQKDEAPVQADEQPADEQQVAQVQ